MNMTVTFFHKHLSIYLCATCIKMSGAISISSGLTPINTFHCVSQLLVQLHQQLFQSTTPNFCHTFCTPPSNISKTLPDFADPSKVLFFHWLNIFFSFMFMVPCIIIYSMK